MLEPGTTYTLTIFDSAGDGICCGFGLGAIFVFLGEDADPTQTLVYDDGQYGSSTTHTFVASPSEVFTLPSDVVVPVVSAVPTGPSEAAPVEPSVEPSWSPVVHRTSRKGEKEGRVIPAP